MDNAHLLHTAIELVEALNKSAEKILPREIVDVVKLHSGIAVGSAWIPIPYVDVAVGAGNIWTMYGRINSKIGLSIKNNILKTIASGVLTNLTGYLAVSGVASTMKLVPGLGSIGGGIVLSASLYAVTLCSGWVYLKALLLLARKNNGNIEIGQLGDAIKDVMKDETTIKNFINAAKEDYKNDKQNK